jgi:hypothetical protein
MTIKIKGGISELDVPDNKSIELSMPLYSLP